MIRGVLSAHLSAGSRSRRSRFASAVRISVLAIAVATMRSAVPAGEPPAVYEVLADSEFTQGCYPPCRCLIRSTPGVAGTFTVVHRDSDPLFEHYEIRAIDWTIPEDPPRRVIGSGTYSIGGEVAVEHSLELDVSIDGGEVQHLVSGRVVGGAGFPRVIEATVAENGMVCFDTVFALRARRVAGGFDRGDCNADGSRDVSDVVAGLRFLFQGGAAPDCFDACDANDDSAVDLSDAPFLLGHLFLGGPPPPRPFGACGVDPTGDALTCASFAPCGDDGNDCAEEIAAIARESSIVGSCSAVVRLDHETRSLIGWQLVCGRYASVREDEARAQSERDTGFGEAGRSISGESPEDLWVFYESPGDFGGVGVVSARTGLTVFGGGIVWLGRGEISFPREWRPAASLGARCEPVEPARIVSSYDLARDGEPLEQETVDAVLAIVWSTALPAGLWTAGYVFDVVVLRYPRTVGAFDPSSAEWIVIVNGGWLE